MCVFSKTELSLYAKLLSQKLLRGTTRKIIVQTLNDLEIDETVFIPKGVRSADFLLIFNFRAEAYTTYIYPQSID